MSRHINKAREQLGELSGLAERTRRTEQRILEQAESRLAQVEAEIAKSRPGVEAAPDDKQQHYQSLISERGQLHMVIAQAKEHLK